MPSAEVAVRSSEGPPFDCYLAAPDTAQPVPAIVLASSIRGVDDDLRGIADELAAGGFIAAAPDLFWRTVPGPLEPSDSRAALRGQPRLEKIRTGEQDLADVVAMLRKLPYFNGKAAVMGFCYGGPYAVLGPKRLGLHAGIACHGSQMHDYLSHLEGMRQPVCILWGDQDHLAPAPVREAYVAMSARMRNLRVQIFPGVRHGYMMRGNATAFDSGSYRLSMDRAFEQLARLGPG
jgi:carboxymethylenebutenolidase